MKLVVGLEDKIMHLLLFEKLGKKQKTKTKTIRAKKQPTKPHQTKILLFHSISLY